jgi:hypothetical protein
VTRKLPPLSERSVPGVIRADELYTRDEFMQRLSLGEDAMTTARRRGLKSRFIGRKKYILGSEAIEYLKSCPSE